MAYEIDLLNELKSGQHALYMAGLIESETMNVELDKLFVLSDTEEKTDEDFLPVCYILPAQLIGFFKSQQLGLNPDNPSTNGVISRVVKGVTIYPY